MIIWINHYKDETDESKGYSYFHTKASAKRAADDMRVRGLNVETNRVEVPCTRAGMIRALNSLGGHPDNG